MPRSFAVNRAVLASLALVIGACSSATEPVKVPNLSVLLGPNDWSNQGRPAIVVTGKDVVFHGVMSTPCLGYDIRTDATRITDGYLITLRGKQAGDACLAAIGRYPYVGTLFDVPSGSARVIVRHLIEDANWPVDTLIDSRVVVP